MRVGARRWLTRSFDTLLAACAVVVIAAPHWTWYVATLTPPGVEVMAPSGTATGLSAHVTLLAVTFLAIAQLVLLLARHFPGGRLRMRGDRAFLVCSAVVVCLLVVADADLMPISWANTLSVSGATPQIMWPNSLVTPLDGTTLTLSWGNGATAAVAAALALLLAAIASPGLPAMPPVVGPNRHSSPAAGGSLQATAAE